MFKLLIIYPPNSKKSIIEKENVSIQKKKTIIRGKHSLCMNNREFGKNVKLMLREE